MNLIKIKKKKLPDFIRKSPLFADNSDSEYVYVPELFLLENNKVTNISEYKKLFGAVKYFMLKYPNSLKRFQSKNEDEVLEFLLPNRDQEEEKTQIQKIKKEICEKNKKEIIEDYNEINISFETEKINEESYKLYMILKAYGEEKKFYINNLNNFQEFSNNLLQDGSDILKGYAEDIDFGSFLVKMKYPFNRGVTFEFNEGFGIFNIKTLTIYTGTEDFDYLAGEASELSYQIEEMNIEEFFD